MINLGIGFLPIKRAVGVCQVIQYLRELGGYDDNFTGLPDAIEISAVRVFMPTESFMLEAYRDSENPIRIRILDKDLRNPTIEFTAGSTDSDSVSKGKMRFSFIANPFRDVKIIEEYPERLDDENENKYKLIKFYLGNKMEITFLKWVD